MLYVVDDSGRLIDDIRMRRFLLTPLDETVSELMDNQFIALKANDSQEDGVSAFRAADLPALPVTDSDGILIGIVTYDDMLDVAERLATRDQQKFGGLEALDLPYIQTPFLQMIQKRAGWLIILFLSEMLTASAMGYFDEEISKAVVLALFVPLIISSGGNSGSQAATLIIRAMALKELTLRDWWYVMRREIFSGLALGTILGIIGFVRIAIWQKLHLFDYTEHWAKVALTILLSLIGIVMWGTLSGSMIPFVLKRLGLDPATSSAPFVATLVDVTGLVIYYSGTDPDIFFRVVSPVWSTGMPPSTSLCGRGMTWTAVTVPILRAAAAPASTAALTAPTSPRTIAVTSPASIFS
jgi:magnesium transporter